MHMFMKLVDEARGNKEDYDDDEQPTELCDLLALMVAYFNSQAVLDITLDLLKVTRVNPSFPIGRN